MMKKFDVLVDSAAFVGRFYANDAHHQKAVELFGKYEGRGSLLVTTSAVVGETATVLSHREGQELARMFLSVIRRSGIPVIHIDEKFHIEALRFFEQQEKRGTSYVDCTNAVVANAFSIPVIFSFDDVFVKDWNFRDAA